MRFLKECLIVLLMTAFSMTVSAKEPVTYNGYTLAEVTGNNINIRSGAGTDYPIAYYYSNYGDEDIPKTRQEVSPAAKGSRYWVKDAGDWWEIYFPGDAQDSKQFISKKYCKALETDLFDIDSITEPQVYVYSKKEEGYEPGEWITSTTVMTIYPSGDVVTQYMDDYGNNIAFGEINKERTAIQNLIQTMGGFNSMDVAPNAPLAIEINTESMPPMFNGSIGEKNMSSFKWKGKKIEYADISGVSLDEWLSVIQKLVASPNFEQIHNDPYNTEVWITRDEMNKAVRIK
jgi:hypothetical protein